MEIEGVQKTRNVALSYNALAAVFLVAVFALAAFQTLQLSELKVQVDAQGAALTGLNAGAGFTPVQTQPVSSGGIPSSLQNIPDMVGGC